MHKLELALNVDAAMGAARDYFERVMREVHGNAPGSVSLASRGDQSSFVATRTMYAQNWQTLQSQDVAAQSGSAEGEAGQGRVK